MVSELDDTCPNYLKVENKDLQLFKDEELV
jgi:hypothetical protein